MSTFENLHKMNKYSSTPNLNANLLATNGLQAQTNNGQSKSKTKLRILTHIASFVRPKPKVQQQQQQRRHQSYMNVHTSHHHQGTPSLSHQTKSRLNSIN